MADFATVAELETYMGVAPLGARGTAMLGYASAAVRRYCQQDLELTSGRQESYAGDAWRVFLTVTQRPVTAVSAITIDGVAFTDFSWTRWGQITKTDFSPWDTGPILVTYDSGYAPTSDEMQSVKMTTCSVASRALGGDPETYGLQVEEVRGPTPAMYMNEYDRQSLDAFQTMEMA